MRLNILKDEAEYHNSIWERIHEWNQVFVLAKLKIKIKSGSGWKNEINCS